MNRVRSTLLAATGTILLLAGCSGDGGTDPDPTPSGAPDLFDQGVVHSIDLTLAASDWDALHRNFQANTDYTAEVAIDGETVRNMAIRSRGSGTRNGRKPGLKLDFNRRESGQRFRGFTSLVLENLYGDPSFLHERLAFAAFESVGPNDFAYRGPDPRSYVPTPFSPETNEDGNEASGLIAFLQTVSQAPDASFAADVAAFVDVDRVLLQLALEEGMAEVDGLTSVFGTNNFYLYQTRGTRRFTIVPWDRDFSFSRPDWPVYSEWSGTRSRAGCWPIRPCGSATRRRCGASPPPA